MTEQIEVVVVGGGQAGLSLSHELGAAGIEHVVLERGRVGQSWRNRWDSFCLVLPNWTIRLAGRPYQGSDPDGFMARDAFVEHLAEYATSFEAPVREGVDVLGLETDAAGGFLLETSTGAVRAREIVVATGGYQRPHRPQAVEQLAARLPVIDAIDYRSPAGLPDGRVLVIGSGQSGCQIAEELRAAGREVVLSCGRAPWQPRRVGGRDIIAWVEGTPFMSMTLADLPTPLARLGANPQASGKDGGHDLHYRTLQAMGVVLAGHLLGVSDGQIRLAPDLADSVAFGDARYDDIRRIVAGSAAAQGVAAPDMPAPPPFRSDPPLSVELGSVACAVVAAGFRPDYQRWIRIPDAFDAMGFPLQVDGSSTVVEGLHFMGVPFQRTRASATLMGVGGDATVLARRMAARRAAA